MLTVEPPMLNAQPHERIVLLPARTISDCDGPSRQHPPHSMHIAAELGLSISIGAGGCFSNLWNRDWQ